MWRIFTDILKVLLALNEDTFKKKSPDPLISSSMLSRKSRDFVGREIQNWASDLFIRTMGETNGSFHRAARVDWGNTWATWHRADAQWVRPHAGVTSSIPRVKEAGLSSFSPPPPFSRRCCGWVGSWSHCVALRILKVFWKFGVQQPPFHVPSHPIPVPIWIKGPWTDSLPALLII